MYLQPQIPFIVTHSWFYTYMNVAIITISQFTPLVSTDSTLGLLLNVTGVAERQEDLIPGG